MKAIIFFLLSSFLIFACSTHYSREDFAKVIENIKKRDRIDSGRKESPLKQADDAILLDNSQMTIEDQMKWFFETFRDRLNGRNS